MMRISLRTRILLLIAGTVAGLAVIVLAALAALTGREINRAVRSDVRATGSVLAQFIAERDMALRDQSLLMARQPTLMARLLGLQVSDETAPPVKPDARTVTDSLREWLAEMHADAALLTDQDGLIQGDTDAQGAILTARSAEPGVGAAMQGQTWSSVVLRKNRLMLAVSVPVREPVSKYVEGTFTAYSAIDAQVAADLKKAMGSDVAFVHQGEVLAASLVLPAHLSVRSDMPTLRTLNGNRYFALYAPLPHTAAGDGMGFVVLRPYGPAMALYHRFLAVLVTVSVLALLLALTAGVTVSRGITRPLDGVVRAAEIIRAGEWPEQFAVRRSDEIGLLQTVFNEMTESIQASQKRLLALIDTDPLTELDNHRRFQERLHQETRRSVASGEALSLLLLDLDHFQQFNQRHGHAEGDAALQQLGTLLRQDVPEVAILARYGGEEFAVLLPRHDTQQAEAVAERLRAAVEQTWTQEGVPMLSASVGCAEFGRNTSQAEGLLLAAELAVQQAKELGRNRICRFDSVPGADENADPYQLHRFLKDGSLATIQALAAAVDAKDPYTQGHSQRVADYAMQLAYYVGLPPSEAELIHTTGTLHDVGKIGVPDAVLKKPGRLDPEEQTVMQTHPVLGEVIVRKVPQLAATLPGVRHHHEQWDGNGYPDRLAGEDIPLMARILALADTFDAMTSDRPYRKGLAWEIAMEEITRKAGTQFDPALAPAFVEMMQSRRELRRAA